MVRGFWPRMAKLIAPLLLLTLAACVSPVVGPSEVVEPGCTDGASAACSCADGRRGAQVCADGAYGACLCERLACVDGQSASCNCEDGAVGAQVCAEGMFGECMCEPPRAVCIAGTTQACVCEDGEAGVQSCGTDETFEPCFCEPPPCMEAQCGLELSACDADCLLTLACIEECTDAPCKADCFWGLPDLTRRRAEQVWECSAACGTAAAENPIPAGYPALGVRERCRMTYFESAASMGGGTQDRDVAEGVPFDDALGTEFGWGYDLTIGVGVGRDYVHVQVESLSLGTYGEVTNPDGEAALVIRSPAYDFLFTSEETLRPLPVVHIDGTAQGIVWGRVEGAACSNFMGGCIYIRGTFSSHVRGWRP